MFRIKILALSIILLLLGAGAFFADSLIWMGDVEKTFNTRLAAGRIAAEQVVDQWVNRNVDRAIDLANDPAIRTALGDAKAADPKQLKENLDQAATAVTPRLTSWLEAVRKSDRPDWIVIVNAEGRVIVRNNAPHEPGEAIFGIPLVRTMLEGAALDGIWAFDQSVYSVVGAATMVGDEVAGGVVLGYQLSSTRINLLALGMPQMANDPSLGLAMLWNGNLLGTTLTIEQSTRIPASPDATAFGPSQLAFGPFPLMASGLGQYIGVARPTTGWPETLLLVVAVPHSVVFEMLAQRQFVIMGFTALLLLLTLLWGQIITRSMIRPLNLIVDHLSSVQRGTAIELLPEVALKEPFLRLGKLINMLISTRTGSLRAAAGAKADEFSQLLGSQPTLSSQPGAEEFQFEGIPGLSDESAAAMVPSNDDMVGAQQPDAGFDFGAAGLPETAVAPSEPMAVLPQSALEPIAESPFNAPQPAFDASSQSGIASLFDDAGDLEPPPAPVTAEAIGAPDLEFSAGLGDLGDAPAQAPPPPMPYTPSPVTYPSPAVPAPAPAAPPRWNPERTVMVQVPDELIAASAVSSPRLTQPPPPISGDFDDGNPEATVVASVSPDVIQAAMAGADIDPDGAHFHEIYDQFLATRRECGEQTADLTYERFVVKLKRNREQLVSKYGCRTVRFQVYVKAGKAALKAVPVRD
ncbi:MAG: hypothetical protein JXR83_01770 [Deltaproteobacteria bacterium]|nr:hypothetical protein [Deltaproteobacteria bacterium]